MVSDYRALDVFFTPLIRKGVTPDGAPELSAVVPGIEERHPPVQARARRSRADRTGAVMRAAGGPEPPRISQEGDVVLMRLDGLTQYEVPLVVQAVIARKELRMLPAWADKVTPESSTSILRCMRAMATGRSNGDLSAAPS